ncbi:MAG: ABC transporter ATP-binding protein [Clostridia bacterium]|nr:ABC transporter ATP-binding protein [Clostridia bacterium]
MAETENKTIRYPVLMGVFPQDVKDYFLANGLPGEDLLLGFASDLSAGGVFCDCYVLLTKDAVWVAEGTREIRFERTFPSGRKVKAARYNADRLRVIPLSEIDDPQVEMLISSGRAVYTAKKDGTDISEQMFAFSATYSHDATVFCRAVAELKEQGSVDPATLRGEDASFKICPKCGRRFPDKGRRYCPHCLEKTGLAVRMFRMFRTYKWPILLVFLTLLLQIGFSLVIPYISNSVLYEDVLSATGKWAGRVGLLVLALIAARILSLLINLVTGAVNAKVAADVTYDLKKTIYRSVSRLSLAFFTNRQTGSLMTQINSDSTTIYGFFCDGFLALVTQGIQLVVLLVVMFTINVELTLWTFATVPLFFLAFQAISRLFEKLHARNWSRRSSYNSLISDLINGVRVVKAFSREDAEEERFRARSEASAEAGRQLDYTASRIFPFLHFFLRFGMYVVWLIGGWRVMTSNGLNYAMLMTFTAYFGMVSSPIEMLSDITDWWSECLNALKRLFDIQDSKVDVKESDHPVTKEIRGDLEFRDVTFSYVENRKILKNVSFSVGAGQTVGIVGRTGAGKSTIANLIMRLYDCTGGVILLDGTDIRDYSFECLRKNVAIVSQETYLFNGTILENIRYARPDATFEDVVRVAKAAHAHEFIMREQDGYQTRIGQGGKQLSGGEKQRVSIARALLKNPRILILDEATSAMDTQTERNIQKALTELSRGRTTILIAHRLSTLRDADFLLSIEDGRVVEQGTAAELMAAKGVYYRLYTLQAEALKNIGIAED